MSQLMMLMVTHAVAVVFFASFAARVGLPVPAAAVLVVAGALIALGQVSFIVVLVASIVANLLGDAAWFYTGRRYGYRFLRLLCRISISPDSCVRRSESLITRWGGMSLVAAKFVPGVSVVAAPMAGALGMSSARFVVFDSGAALLWAGVYLGVGLVFRDRIQQALDAISRVGGLATVALVIVLLLMLAVRLWRRRRFQKLTTMPRITVDELHALREGVAAPLVIDVRGDAGLQVNPLRIPGALPFSLKAIQQRRTNFTFDRERDVVLYCDCPNEVTSALAARALIAQGAVRRALPLAGGLDAWVKSGRQTAVYA